MTEVTTLLTQIARANRFAAAMTNDAERERFAAMAAELETELAAISYRLQNSMNRMMGGGFFRV